MRRWFTLTLSLLVVLVAGAAPPAPLAAQPTQQCFSQTGFCISGSIRSFWERNGGLSTFGYPITAQADEIIGGEPRPVQWFERARIEIHSDMLPPDDVMLGRIGADSLLAAGRDWQAFPRSEPQSNCQYIAATGHNVCGDFLAYWRRAGAKALALFGMPLGDAQTEEVDGVQRTTQWFERARFELHADAPATARVQLGLLGSSLRRITSDKIADAMRAGPMSLSRKATIMDWPASAGATMPILREGTNGWTCFPDDPTTPSVDDPQCLDKQWMNWNMAFMAGETPHTTEIGIGYMLQGGAVADNDDPSLLAPPAGKDWQIDPRHIMIITPWALDQSYYPTKPGNDLPWIMWKGTPYEHLMVPIPDQQPALGKGTIANAVSAAPAGIAAQAGVVDWPGADGKLVPVRDSANGWWCMPDDIALEPHTPTDDPMCYDNAWRSWWEALFAGQNPAPHALGISYMLQNGTGGWGESPADLVPPPGVDDLIDPPHIMLVSPRPIDLSQMSTDMDAGIPFVMWENSPYQHIMVPVPYNEDKILNAMSAAPMAVAKNATVLDWPSQPGGDIPVLRQGVNGWTCFPDDPTTSASNDPQCLDKQWMDWNMAFMAGQAPHTTSLGIGYMLQGGVVADNDDPSAVTPPPGKDWQVDPPHIMLIFPEKLDLSKYPTRPGGDLPWVMFAGTPYEHMMVPVPSALPRLGKGAVANAMSAGPDGLGRRAAIADWPRSGTNFSIVRKGGNGWTCIPDDIAMQPHTITDDPMCLDQSWFEWMSASLAGRSPRATRPGIGYMLQGGSEGSNTDPAAVEPPAGQEWQIDPPHIMVIMPTPLDQSQIGTDPRYGRPWVMFAGTPFEHAMIPVR